jgi:membrane-associated phospholipid phosphatase
VLFVCLAIGWGKRWFIYFTIPFAIAIFVGSIVLGWHYAVDGYMGGLVAWFSWWLAGKLHFKSFAKAEPTA